MPRLCHLLLILFATLGFAALPAAGQNQPNAIVSGDGKGTHTSIQEAVNAAPSQLREGVWTILIRQGYYHEPVRIPADKPHLRLLGEDPMRCTIAYLNTEHALGPDGKALGLAGSASLNVEADDFCAENLCIANSAGPNGGAVALRLAADRSVVRNCRLLGWTSTLLLEQGRHYFEDCRICGDRDYISGRGKAWFERCDLHSIRSGAIVATSSTAGSESRFVFARCRLSGESESLRCFLGRTVAGKSMVLFLQSEFAGIVDPAGWEQAPAGAEVFFAECECRGQGAENSRRGPWAKILSEEDGAAFTRAGILGGNDGWLPELRTNPPPIKGQRTQGDIFELQGFTLEGVLRLVAKTFPQAGASRVDEALPQGVQARENIAYLKHPGQNLELDLYRPADTKLRPAVLIIHGGGWLGGNRQMERPLARHLAARGFVAVPVSYRLCAEGVFPKSIHDLKAALRWLRAHAEEYGIDAARIGVIGGSAGGTLATNLGASNGVAALEGNLPPLGFSSEVQAVVCLDGAVSFMDNRLIEASIAAPQSRFRTYLGGSYAKSRETWIAASPLFYLNPRSAPTLFVNSTSVQPILPGREDMMTRLRAFGIDSEMVVLKDTPHPFWLVHPWFETCVDQIDRFMTKHLRSSKPQS